MKSNSRRGIWEILLGVCSKIATNGVGVIREEVLGNAGCSLGRLSAAGERSVLLLYE